MALDSPATGARMKDILKYFLVLSIVRVGTCSRLNVPRVLLPFSDLPPKFSLSADSGCYVWSSTRPDILKLQQEQLPCSSSAAISAVSQTGSKVSVSVLAEDPTSGLVLRADVILDNIHQLRIVTKTHELYKEETPEKFEVRAYDEQGNEFSTVEGMVFKWSIEAGRTGAEILRFMNWADSPYNTKGILENLENEGKQGNKVLLEGIKTGSAKVTVRLVDSINPAVPATSESLMVVANLFLVPPIAYIMPGAQLQYSANQFRGSRVIKVTLPSPHHQLNVEDSLASLDQRSATLTGLNIGAGQVELVDQNVDAGEVVKTPTADLHVVPPVRLELTCLPFKSWSVLVGQTYQLQVEIFDKDSNKIFLSDNIVIDLVYDQKFLGISHSLDNGTLHTFKPTLPGQTDVKAILRGVTVKGVLRELPSPLSATGTLDIFEKMTLEPALVRLPWDPISAAGTTQQTKYTVKGGSSPYSWSSLNSSLVTVSQMGVARILTSSIGETKIMAAMTRATHNKAMGSVVVVPAVALELLTSELEFPVGSQLVLPIGLFPKDYVMYSRCESVPYTTDVSAKKEFKTSIVAQEKPGCAGLQVEGTKLMHTKVSLEFSYPSAETGKLLTLSASRTVATYSPLSPVFPASGETVVAVDSSVQIVWTGGPQPWPLDPSNHFRKLSVEQDKLVKVETLRELGGVYVYRVECLSLGETSVTLSVGNEESKSLPKPVVLASTVKVICGTPASIHLTPRIEGPQGLPPCPASARAGRIATQSYRNLDIGVTLKDAAGRVFDGIESVAIDWALSDGVLAKLAKSSGSLKSVQKDWLEQPGRPYQTLQVMKKKGKLDVSASLPSSGFLSSSASKDKVMLTLVDDARIEPDKLQIFHHNTQQVVASAIQGSGYFILEAQQKGVSKAEYIPDNRSISVSPLQPGTTDLVLKDLCLSAVRAASTSLTVLGVVRVELDVLDKIQLGRKVDGTVRLYAANNQLLSEDILQYISLTLTPQTDIVSLKDSTETLTPLVTGAKLGQTTIVATATYHGIQVSSAPSPVQVFPPLKIDPRNITLIIGAAFQVLTTGGPTDATIQYFLSNTEIGEVSSDGLVAGLTLGSCKLVGRAVGRSRSGEVVEYSRDEVHVHVVALSALRLVAPTKKIVVGGALPIYLLGQDDNIDGYSFGSALPNLEITWTAKGSVESQSLVSSWQSTGFSLDTTNTGIAVFKGLTAGKAIINVRVKITKSLGGSQYQLLQDRELSASIEISVVDRFQAKIPEMFGNHLLMTPGSTLQLHTNRDGRAVFSSACDVQSQGLTVNKRGLVTAGSGPAKAVVRGTIQEDGGVSQETSWVVEVGAVHYILMQSVNSAWSLDPLRSTTHLPKGGKLDIQVSCYDILGRRFDGCPVDLNIRPSRFDLTKTSSINNNTFALTTLGSGLTVLRTADRLSGKVAWGILEVGEAVLAPAAMVQGDVADLNLLVKPTQNGVWSCEPSGILDVSTGGIAVAIGTGYARIKYTTPSSEVFYTDITVNGNTGIKLAGDPVLTRSNDPLVIPVRFTNPGAESNVLDSMSLPNSVSLDASARALFSCSATWSYGDLNQVYTLRPVFEESGWGCEFAPVPGAFFPETPQLVKIRVTEVKGGRIGGGDISYLPPFSVSSNVVEVGPSGAVIKVSGDSEVLAMLSTKGEGVSLDSGWLEESQLLIPVHLLSPIPRDAWVLVENTRTGEEVRVGVQPTFQGSPNSRGFISALVDILLAYYQTVLTLLVATACLLFFLRQPASTKPPPPPAPAASPAKTGAAGGDEAGSPTPYLWTVDNSPIYGSPLMRRTSPQARNLSQYSYS